MLELEYLQVSTARSKSDFLQHITELVHIKIDENDTYNTMFDKLKDFFKDSTDERKKAAEDWVLFNQTEQPDRSVFDTKLLTDVDDLSLAYYAIFNLKRVYEPATS